MPREVVKDIPVLEYKIENPDIRHVYIIPFYDMHIGDEGFNQALFLGYREWILERNNAYCYFGGDNLNSPIKRNRASEIWDEYLMPHKARSHLINLLKPLAEANRILGFIDGNHEYRVWEATGESPTISVIRELGLSTNIYHPENIIIKIKLMTVKNNFIDFFIYVVHGWGGARMAGGQVNKIEQLNIEIPNADVYTAVHEHSLTLSRIDDCVITDRAKYLITNKKWFIGCGTLCGWTKFQRRIQRRRPNLGLPRIRLGYKITQGVAYKDIHISM